MFCRKCGKDIGELEKCPFCDFEEYASAQSNNKGKSASKGNGKKHAQAKGGDVKAPFSSSSEAIKKWRKQSKIGKASFAMQIVALAFFASWMLLSLFAVIVGELGVGFMSNLPTILGFSGDNDPDFVDFFANKLIPGFVSLLFMSMLLLFAHRLLDDFAKISFGRWLHKKKYNAKKTLSGMATREKANDDYLTIANWTAHEKGGRVLCFVSTGVSFFCGAMLCLFFSTFFSKLSYALYESRGKDAFLTIDFFALLFFMLSLAVFGIVSGALIKKKSEEFLSK